MQPMRKKNIYMSLLLNHCISRQVDKKLLSNLAWLTHTLLPRTLCSLAHFADSYFAPQNISLLNTFWSLKHFASRNTLLPSSFCFLEQSAPWNTFLPGKLCSFVKFFNVICPLEHKKQSIQGSKVCWGEKYSWEQSVLRSKVCW